MNSRGELVGLIWTEQELPDGTQEEWITPASAWFAYLQQSSIPSKDKQSILGLKCE